MKTMPSSQATAAAVVFSITFAAAANPTGGTVQHGSATINTSGSTLNINAGNNAVINWQSFNIGSGERTVFNQPSSSSVVINRVNDPNPSQIFGSLQANGVVVLLNSSGFYFGPNSFVSAAGLVVSTANCAPPQNAGGAWTFNGPPPLVSIVNYGQIKIGNGGDCFLIADQVQNHGDIEAPGGNIGLAAGQTVTLSERPDGRGMTMQVTLPEGSVDNHGNIIADGGTIALNAQVVNQGGFIQANSVKDDNGVIELVASDSLNLESGSQISASGDASAGGSAGGTVTLQSGNTFSDAAGSQITVTGGANGGNGGNVEVSAPTIESLNTAMNASAQAGSLAGTFLLDPTTINLGASGTGTVPANGTVASGSTPTTLNLNVNTAFANKNFSNIKLQATGNINLLNGTTWDLSGSTGQTSGQLTLEAGGNINLNDGSQIVDENNWSVNLMAGYNFTTSTIKQGTGSILFSGSGSIQTTAGAVNLQAGNGITLGSGSIQSASGPITLEAGGGTSGGITLGDGSQISDGGNGMVTVDAGYNFSQGAVVTGSSSLLLNGSSFIQTSAGSINLAASDNITVNSGYVNTTGGGNISAHALTGDIDAGSDAQAYVFVHNATTPAAAYNVSGGLGGITTAAGGNLNLTAGGNVTTVLPAAAGQYEYDGGFVSSVNAAAAATAGSGAYGRTQAGNVTVIAGGDVVGNYVVAKGVGSIYAGVQMDSHGNPIANGNGYLLGSSGNAGDNSTLLALNLINGGWNVTAAQNILLQEVRNPNGLFNTVGSAAVKHLFDYGANDYVDLNAGNQVQLGSSSYPRLDASTAMPEAPVYPGILNITSGSGGVVLNGTTTYNDLILYPSPSGSLVINTTGGGPLVGNLPLSGGEPQLFNLILSDSGSDQYLSSTTFGANDHAASPVHYGSESPVQLNISGDMDLVQLDSPEAAQINVVGNMNNSAFQGMNLSASDTTSITVGAQARVNLENSGILNSATDGGLTVGGNITDRGAFTSVDLSAVAGAGVPDFSVLAYALTPAGYPSGATLVSSFFYNPTTHVLTYENISGSKSLQQILNALQNLTVQVVINGVPQWQDALHTIPVTTTVSAISAAAANALLTEYNTLGPLPKGNSGFAIGGGGQFNITANNMDLGTTPGVASEGVGFYQNAEGFPLAKYFDTGANLYINLSGSLTMYSSSIASYNGGNIFLLADGTVNAGSADFTVNTGGARGIFTSDHGDCTLIAGGDINVNGSRIATFDGGNLTVESLNGNINAGAGGQGFVTVSSYFVDPITHAVTSVAQPMTGTGLISATFPSDPSAQLGNILVEALNGDINAQSAGVVQYSLNQNDGSHATVEVLAGEELEDAHGNPVYADDLASGTPVTISLNHNINASGLGVIAENAILRATGNVSGTILSQHTIDLVAPQISNLQAIGPIITAVGNIGQGDEFIGSESVTTSGGGGGAEILSGNANGGGSTFVSANAAGATSAAASAQSVADATKSATQSSDAGFDDQNNKKKSVTLAQKVSRVTVILPGKY
jgi:filamentous hemagglutinin family protein